MVAVEGFEELEVHKAGRIFLIEVLPLAPYEPEDEEVTFDQDYACRVSEIFGDERVILNVDDLIGDVLVFPSVEEAGSHGWQWIKDNISK